MSNQIIETGIYTVNLLYPSVVLRSKQFIHILNVNIMKTTEKCQRVQERDSKLIMAMMMSDLPNNSRSQESGNKRTDREEHDSPSRKSSTSGPSRKGGNQNTQREGSGDNSGNSSRNK